jgi:predicted SprT family Zn-dependent metalloprotease
MIKELEMKYYCKCGELIADIKRHDLFSTFGRRTWLEGKVLKIKCKKCREIIEIELRKKEDMIIE